MTRGFVLGHGHVERLLGCLSDTRTGRVVRYISRLGIKFVTCAG
jgi:hypothetical protein